MKKTLLSLLLLAAMLVTFAACGSNPETEPGDITQPTLDVQSDAPETTPNPQEDESAPQGHIYLYGEAHGVESILNYELELWNDYYHNQGLRHLFVEDAYYTAEFLNLWMQAEDDAILDQVYKDWWGTQASVPAVKEFYQGIKRDCPETIFHGTDVGHQHDTTGARYLQYLRDNGQTDSPQYTLAEACIKQGRTYYGVDKVGQDEPDDAYRENKMTENFIRAFDELEGESVVGFYGAAHTYFDGIAYGTKKLPCMANQLKNIYGDRISSTDISAPFWEAGSPGEDVVTIDGKEYAAYYFGGADISELGLGYQSREYWRLEDAYEDFKDLPATDNYVFFRDYPIEMEEGKVYVIEYKRTDGTGWREYHRADGDLMYGTSITRECRSVIDPQRTDAITVNGKEYTASYFGEEDISAWSKDYLSREVWRLEDAYEDFKNFSTTHNCLPYNLYPMAVEDEQVYIIDYHLPDGSIRREYHCSGGIIWHNMPATVEFTLR